MRLAPPWPFVIGAALAGIAIVLILDDRQRETRRREENASLAASARAARELPPLPQSRPTPQPMPQAKGGPDGFRYPELDPEFDPCGPLMPRLKVRSDNGAVAS